MDQKHRGQPSKKTNSYRTKVSKLTAADIDYFKKMLLKKRGEILGDVNEMEGETLGKSRIDATGDLSCMPIHMADLGTDNYDQEFTLDLMDGERKLLNEIDDALGRIQNNTYGICEGTGQPIPKSRLKAQPWARYSVEYARKLESGDISEE